MRQDGLNYTLFPFGSQIKKKEILKSLTVFLIGVSKVRVG